MKRGSFTQDVKEEICSLEMNELQTKALLSGFVKTNAVISKEMHQISLNTENSKIAKLIFQCFQSIYHITPSFNYQKKMKLDKCVVYHIKLIDEDFKILKDLQLFNGEERINPRELVLDNTGLRSFISGVFLASGSVNSPKSENYHLQMVVNNENDGKYLIKLLNRFHNERSMDFKMISRRNRYVVYLKKADQIANYLAVCNACVSLMEFENVRIQKDFINSDNRYQICFNANYQKTMNKALEQLKDINLIKEKGGFDLLEEKQQIVANIRLNNTDVPLSQISELIKEEYGIVISKSSVNRIFMKIHDIALQYGGKKHE